MEAWMIKSPDGTYDSRGHDAYSAWKRAKDDTGENNHGVSVEHFAKHMQVHGYRAVRVRIEEIDDTQSKP